MIENKDDFYHSISILIKQFLKLKNEEEKFRNNNINKKKEFYKIYKQISSLRTKNKNEYDFKIYCMTLIQSGLPKSNKINEKQIGNIVNINNNRNNLKNKKEKVLENTNTITIKEIYVPKEKMFININHKKNNDMKEEEKDENKNLFNFTDNKSKNKNIKDKHDFDKDIPIIEEAKVSDNKITTLTLNKKNKEIKHNNFKCEEIKVNENKKYMFNNNKNGSYDRINNIIDKLINDKINQKIIKEFSKYKDDENNNQFRVTISEYFQKLYQVLVNLNLNKNIKIEQSYINKLLTLICLVFPFLMKNQKEQLLKINIDKETTDYLKNNLLLFNAEENNKINKILLSVLGVNNKKEEEKEKKVDKLKEIINDIFIDSPELIKNVYYAYQLILLYKIFVKNDDKLTKIKLLAFKIHFILSNDEIFSLKNDIDTIFKELLLMKLFYTTVYNNEIKGPFILNCVNYKKNGIIYGDKYFKMNYYRYIDIDILFDNNDNEIYHQIMDREKGIIFHFYKINNFNKQDLIDSKSFFIKENKNKFLNNIFSIVNIKNNFIKENFNKYKHNLIKLEKEIFYRGKQFLNNKSQNIIYQYSRKVECETLFNKFSNTLDKYIDIKYKKKYKLYPFGSSTEFLSTDKSDLDIYLHIEELNIDKKVELLNHIFDKCQKFCKKVEKIISLRICLIKLEFEGNEIDLSITGFCPYIHSFLYKEYSLIDPRFPLIAIALKKFLNILNLKKENYYLNSFSWMTLLVVFLQDIIQPPVLPKLFSEHEINKIYYKTVEFGNKFKNYDKKAQKTFLQFFQSAQKETIPIPDCLFNRRKIQMIYNKLYKNKDNDYNGEKNKLSCAEIFLKFLEFISLYFKYDSIYVRCSIEKEGFYNMNEIQYFEVNDNEFELYKYKSSFYKYFKNKYNKYIDYQNKNKIRDGHILIRDPVDSHYNPGQQFTQKRNLTDFISIIRYSYSILIKYGSFEILETKIKIKNETNNENEKK